MNQKKAFLTLLTSLLLVALLAGSAHAVLPVDLGTAGDFAILASTGISNTGTTSITGDIGVGPAVTSTAISGNFALSAPPTTFTTSPLVTGKVYAYDYDVPTPTKMNTAMNDLGTAYTAANGLAPDATGLGAGDIGGLTLPPGVYKWTTGVTIPTDLTLNGSATDVWVFQIAQTLDISSATEVLLIGGAQAENIFWIVGGTTTLQTTSVLNGNILAGPGTSTIALLTGATLNGRALGQTDVTLQSNTVYLAPAGLVNETNETNVTLSVAPWYPQGNDYILVCDAVGFAPTRYDWIFGDGQKLLGYSDDNVYHVYADGAYNATCIAYNAETSGTGTLALIVGSTPGNQTDNPNETDACYSWLKDIPAVCIGGAITENTDLVTFDNCRHITCENDGNSLSITACEKPDEINPEYFEMYLTDKTGTGIRICLGAACIQDNGFDAEDFPVCTGNATVVPPPETNETNTTTACVSQLENLPASCAGIITHDDVLYGGACRTVSCTGTFGSVTTLNCEKTDTTGTYFEMYRRSSSGLQPQLCLGNDCLRPGWGYERGDYFPICVDNTAIPPVNDTTVPVNETNQTTSATLSVAPWFPQGGNYVFVCDAIGFTPTSYDWDFGDGQRLWDYTQDNTYHSYADGGYTVTCVAKNAETSETAVMDVEA